MEINPQKLLSQNITSEANLKEFDCGIEDLNDFLKDDALAHQRHYLARTTLLYYEDRLVGFYSLACDSIKLDTEERSRFSDHKQISSYPAIKIARMAFVSECQKKGCGQYIVEVVKGLAYKLNRQDVGCRFITVDAKPESLAFYEKRGFTYNRHDDYKKRTKYPSLRVDVWTPFAEVAEGVSITEDVPQVEIIEKDNL